MEKSIPNNEKQQPEQIIRRPSRPNEVAGFNVDAHVKIFDPNTKEIFVEKRA